MAFTTDINRCRAESSVARLLCLRPTRVPDSVGAYGATPRHRPRGLWRILLARTAAVTRWVALRVPRAAAPRTRPSLAERIAARKRPLFPCIHPRIPGGDLVSRRVYAERSAKALSCLLEQRPDLVYYCQPGVAYPDGTLVVDYDLCHLQQADLRNYRCAELQDIAGPCDDLVMNLPRYVPMPQILLDICAASRVLSPAGRLTLIMPVKSGHKRVLAMLRQSFASVAQLSRRPPVFDCSAPRPRWATAPLQHIEHYDPVAKRTLKFLTRPGLFSPKRIDRGTRLLLANAVIPRGCTVLDVGCGYGAIGIVAAARGAQVDMIDCDSRAVALADKNLQENGLPGRTHLASSLRGIRRKAFDVVLTNPPTHGGNDLVLSLFHDMVRVCSSRGHVWAVVGKRLSLERDLRGLAAVAVVAENSTHEVLRLTRR